MFGFWVAVVAASDLAHGIIFGESCSRDHWSGCDSPDNSHYVSSVLIETVEAHLERVSWIELNPPSPLFLLFYFWGTLILALSWVISPRRTIYRSPRNQPWYPLITSKLTRPQSKYIPSNFASLRHPIGSNGPACLLSDYFGYMQKYVLLPL